MQAAQMRGISQSGREALRRAYLEAHLPADPPTERGDLRDPLATWIRRGMPSQPTNRVGAHLSGCANRRAAAASLAMVNRELSIITCPRTHRQGGKVAYRNSSPARDHHWG